MIKSIMYVMLCIRSDLAYAISQLLQFNAKPTSIHEAAAKGVLRYLKATADLEITFEKDLTLKGYSDADGGANEDRKSISEYVYMLESEAISWLSKKQSTIALSTTKAEYIALIQAVKESIGIQQLIHELERDAEDVNVIHEDNQGVIALASNSQFHARIKHIDIQYHFIRECVENNKIKLEYCLTSDMIADVLTKSLAKERHYEMMEKMSLKENTTPSSTGNTSSVKKWECGNISNFRRSF